MDWMYLFYFLLAVFMFFGAKGCRRGEWNGEYTSLPQTKSLQAVMALGVALHHMAQKSCAPWHPAQYIVHGLDVFVPIGYLLVAVFLFCSGLGLYRSLKTKPDYLRAFPRRRVLSIVIAFYLSEIIYLLVRLAVGEKMDLAQALWYLSGLRLCNYNAWYIAVIPFFYLAFYFAFRYSKREGAAILWVTAFTLLYTLLGAFIDHQYVWWMRGEWWYNSIILFPLGLLFGKWETQITAFVKKKYWLFLVGSFVSFFLLYRFAGLATDHWWGYYGETWNDPLKIVHRLGSCAAQWAVCISFVALCFLLMMKVRLGNKALSLLGGVTLELYLIHGIFVDLFGYSFADVAPSAVYIRSVPLYILAVLACSVPATALFHFLWKGTVRLICTDGRTAETVKSK